MGNFFKNLFKSKSKETAAEVAPKNCLVAVADGDIIPLSEVPDPVFAEKMAGDGAAIMIKGDTVVAPADGELTLVFQTKHAFALKLSNGLELLVHIGVDTVSLNGEGFEQLVEQGTKVKAVNTMNLDGKKRRRGMVVGKTAKTKKAIVALTEDSKDIEIFEGL